MSVKLSFILVCYLGTALSMEVTKMRYYYWFKDKIHDKWIVDSFEDTHMITCVKNCQNNTDCRGLALGPLTESQVDHARKCLLLSNVDAAECEEDGNDCDRKGYYVYLEDEPLTTTTEVPTTTTSTPTTTTETTTEVETTTTTTTTTTTSVPETTTEKTTTMKPTSEEDTTTTTTKTSTSATTTTTTKPTTTTTTTAPTTSSTTTEDSSATTTTTEAAPTTTTTTTTTSAPTTTTTSAPTTTTTSAPTTTTTSAPTTPTTSAPTTTTTSAPTTTTTSDPTTTTTSTPTTTSTTTQAPTTSTTTKAPTTTPKATTTTTTTQAATTTSSTTEAPTTTTSEETTTQPTTTTTEGGDSLAYDCQAPPASIVCSEPKTQYLTFGLISDAPLFSDANMKTQCEQYSNTILSSSSDQKRYKPFGAKFKCQTDAVMTGLEICFQVDIVYIAPFCTPLEDNYYLDTEDIRETGNSKENAGEATCPDKMAMITLMLEKDDSTGDISVQISCAAMKSKGGGGGGPG